MMDIRRSLQKKEENIRHKAVKLEHGELITDANVSVFHVAVEVDLFLNFCGPPKPLNHVI